MKTEFEKRGIVWDDVKARNIVPLIRERISVFQDLRIFLREGEYDYFFASPTLEASRVPNEKSSSQETAAHLAYIVSAIAEISD